jgi:tetratricopeptide (TPR) repeat protein
MRRIDLAAVLFGTLLCGPGFAHAQPASDPLATGKQALDHEQWIDAQKFFTNYLRDNPDNVEAQFYLGNAELGAKQYGQAEQIFKKIIAAYPRAWSAYSSLSEVYSAQERWPEFDAQRKILLDAREQHLEGWEKIGNDVIDVLQVGDERWIVREYYPLAGRFHTRYNFIHFDKQGKVDQYISCESDDVDQADFAKRHPRKASAGERSFSLDGYSGNTHSTILFYSEGEPEYSRVRADVLRSLTGQSTPLSTRTVNGLEIPQKPDVPKDAAPPKQP